MFICECGKEFKREGWLDRHRKVCTPNVNADSGVEKNSETTVVDQTLHITVGSTIMLNGHVWSQDPKTYAWKGMHVVNEEVEVKAQEGVNLICVSVNRNGDCVWAVEEGRVLSGEMEIKYLAPVGGKPKAGRRETVDAEEIQLYKDAANKYVEIRDKKLDIEKELRKVSKECRPIIESFIFKRGKESEEGKGDAKLEDYGFIGLMKRTPGKPYLEREDNKIVQWCLDNGHANCVRQMLNVDLWEELKKSGQVPVEFSSSVEVEKMTKDRFSLNITRDDNI